MVAYLTHVCRVAKYKMAAPINVLVCTGQYYVAVKQVVVSDKQCNYDASFQLTL